MSKLSDYNSRVDALVQDDAGFIESAEIDEAITMAVKRYSLHRPQEKAQEYAGDGGYDYDLPSDWVQGFSRIVSVEYPYDEQDPNFIPKEEWTIFLKLVGSTQTRVLRFLTTSPAAADSVRVVYTIPHLVDDSSSTVYANDFEALSSLAASYVCGMLSRKFLQTSDSTIGADAVSYAAKSSAAASRAKELHHSYLDHLGLAETPASGGIKEFDTGFVWGSEHLTHKSWQR